MGDDIVITVVEMAGGQVRLGISAPRDVPVHREELYQEIAKEILAENEAAGTYPGP